MNPSSRRPGPTLPYRPLAGVVPCSGGWLVAAGRLQGITLHADEPFVMRGFVDVLDHRPAFEIIAVHCPIGLLSEPASGGRACDRAARSALGWPRAGAVHTPPSRAEVADWPREAEVDGIIGPYWQRTVYETHPELGYLELNEGEPLRFRKRSPEGQAERRDLLMRRFPGLALRIDTAVPHVPRWRVYDAYVALWTARRIAAHAVRRFPKIPEWDDQGLRMELVV